MSIRLYIRNGDKTNVGGQVETPERKDMLDGRIAAYEDDPVWCPKCGTYGRIGCVGKRVKEIGPGGKRPALADDLCLCECRPYPGLIPSQSTSFSGE
ncbi:PAAR domain-containing protein [Burkholderia stagnalis]|uniref:PAAR domain-containing protein n=1 Tax=Burkholderia stagnalis TaxID=1503054 RepID=UPI0024078E54|nr:PAAR domain-containing protein [Burkholderia stagnalis]